jgi:hypothetical protein
MRASLQRRNTVNLRKVVKLLVLLVLLALSIGIAQAASALPATSGERSAPGAAVQPAVAELAAPEIETDAPTGWSPDCTPVEMAGYESRLHIRCAVGVPDGAATIYFWAIPATKTQFANRFLSLGSTALVAGRHLAFLYTPGDTSGTAFGCAASDCRNVYAVILK